MDNTVQDASHLKNDSGGLIAELDVKEYMETRMRNAREDRAFAFKSKVLDRAREVTNKSYEHEMKILKKGLHDLNAKTPNFKKTLLSTSDYGRSPSHVSMQMLRTKQPKYAQLPTSRREPKQLRSKSLPALIHEAPDIRAISHGNSFSRNSDPVIPPIARYTGSDSTGSVYKTDTPAEYSTPRDTRHVHPQQNGGDRYLEVDRRLDRGEDAESHIEAETTRKRPSKPRNLPPLKQNPDLWRSSTKNFMRRSKYVQSTLSNLYKKRIKQTKLQNEPERPNFIIRREYAGQHPITVHSSLNYLQTPSNHEKPIDWSVENAALKT